MSLKIICFKFTNFRLCGFAFFINYIKTIWKTHNNSVPWVIDKGTHPQPPKLNFLKISPFLQHNQQLGKKYVSIIKIVHLACI